MESLLKRKWAEVAHEPEVLPRGKKQSKGKEDDKPGKFTRLAESFMMLNHSFGCGTTRLEDSVLLSSGGKGDTSLFEEEQEEDEEEFIRQVYKKELWKQKQAFVSGLHLESDDEPIDKELAEAFSNPSWQLPEIKMPEMDFTPDLSKNWLSDYSPSQSAAFDFQKVMIEININD